MDSKPTLSYEDKVFLGVCGGLAEYFRLPPILVRIVFIAAITMGMGIPVLVYLVLSLIMKPK